jgi:hypothetical protein
VSSNANEELDRLAERLDEAFRHAAANLPHNASLRIEEVAGKPDLILSPLEPATLTALSAGIDARLPRVDLPEKPLPMRSVMPASSHRSSGTLRRRATDRRRRQAMARALSAESDSQHGARLG